MKDLKLTTYNVLSPRLASPQQYPSYAREDTTTREGMLLQLC